MGFVKVRGEIIDQPMVSVFELVFLLKETKFPHREETLISFDEKLNWSAQLWGAEVPLTPSCLI